MQYSGEARAIAALETIRMDTVSSVLFVLEHGDDIREVRLTGFGTSAQVLDDLHRRLRAVRDDLVELDLYRLYVGELPNGMRPGSGLPAPEWRLRAVHR
jgi:Ran GTPase-activating protein (RanGAP) involved in mRNA processing and transport